MAAQMSVWLGGGRALWSWAGRPSHWLLPYTMSELCFPLYRENLSVRGTSWWLRFIFLNVCLFILLFFLTTPAIIVNTMDMFNVTHPVESLKVAPGALCQLSQRISISRLVCDRGKAPALHWPRKTNHHWDEC